MNIKENRLAVVSYLDMLIESYDESIKDFQDKIAKGDFDILRWMEPSEILKKQMLSKEINLLKEVILKDGWKELIKKQNEYFTYGYVRDLESIVDNTDTRDKFKADDIARVQGMKVMMDLYETVIVKMEK